jgi:hypothetical protein
MRILQICNYTGATISHSSISDAAAAENVSVKCMSLRIANIYSDSPYTWRKQKQEKKNSSDGAVGGDCSKMNQNYSNENPPPPPAEIQNINDELGVYFDGFFNVDNVVRSAYDDETRNSARTLAFEKLREWEKKVLKMEQIMHSYEYIMDTVAEKRLFDT